jgi:hypothetical protein
MIIYLIVLKSLEIAQLQAQNCIEGATLPNLMATHPFITFLILSIPTSANFSLIYIVVPFFLPSFDIGT